MDTEEGAKADLGGRFAIVPGQPAKSELLRRITSGDDALRMPPVYSGKKLSGQEIDLIQRWIEQGAEWQGHWSFLPPKHPPLPGVQNRSWPRNGIDYFVLRRLEREGLPPSPETDRATLIRRVTLDLTGLPPTLAELDAFLDDHSPQAYEKVVDRLLQSPRYGERMAVRWLDAARYADTNGYQTDAERSMWRWRDWVINAFNRNMPFDQFSIEQIAGDMLPNATLDQKIATGFNRNHRGNGEGGIIPEEYAVEYVVDRVETTSTVWLGLTMGCARCHDHKYDPLTQEEFYRVFAYFNNVPERGKAFKYGNSPPFIPAPTPEQQAELRQLDKKLEDAESTFAGLEPERIRAQRAWEASLADSTLVDWVDRDGLIVHLPLDGSLAGTAAGPDGKAVRAVLEDGLPRFVAGRVGQAASFDGKRFIDAGDLAPFSFYEPFTLAAWIYPTAPDGTIVARSESDSEEKGYGMRLQDGKVQVNLVTRWLDDALRVETEAPLALERWHHVLFTYDGSRLAEGTRIYVNGESQKLQVQLDELNQPFGVTAPLRIGAGATPENRFQGYLDDVRIYDTVLPPGRVAVAATAEPVSALAAIPPEDRTPAQADKLRLCFLDQYAPRPLQQAWRQLVDLRKQRKQLTDSFSTVMVMREREIPRDTFVLVRGAYDRPGEEVTPGVPAVLPGLPAGYENNRLGFARWLVDPSNPLTARVTVNRFWQMFFGVGLVRTVEDFGSQGEWPTHPDLLDWLATEFMQNGWDVKGIVKTIVMSATYRQSSKVTEELLQKDPDNRLLARGPRFRLAAETVRDQALAIAGLLVERTGGPSVKPYQPAGLWTELAGGAEYPQDHGEKLYRRSLYTFWKRTIAPPSMMNFDASARESCIVRATRTNTPLQALNLMNDVTYVEASRMLAERMMTEGGQTPAERIGFGYRLATAQQPPPQARDILLDSFQHYLDQYQTDRAAALQLVSEGEHPRNPVLDVAELASYTTVASLIFNLDETITKE